MNAARGQGAKSRVELVKRADVRRFLQVDDDEVQRMIDQDNLPYIRKPGATKPGVRIFLPDFHEWLVGYAQGASRRIADYPEFLRAFWAAQG